MARHNCADCIHKDVCALWEIQNGIGDAECVYYRPTLTPQNEPLTLEQYPADKQAEGMAIHQAIVEGHCDKCGFLPQCSTQGKVFQFPVFAWCMRRKAEILADMRKEDT